MLKKNLIPSPLILSAKGDEPQRVTEIEEPRPPSRFHPVVLILLVLGWALGLFGRWLFRRHHSPVERARRFRRLLERIGGLWVKAGQFMALRRDVFSDEFCQELARLQDRAKGFPGALARRIIEESQGAPVDRLFSEFEDTPIAAASIGQVHRARLRDRGIRVAVKVQRPWIAERFERDLALISRVCSLLNFFSILPFMRWREFIIELTDVMQGEIDYSREASSINRLRQVIRKHGLYGPKVFFRYSGPRVLTMEYIEGVRMSDYIAMRSSDPERLARWAEENDFRPRRAARRLFFSLQRQCCEDNLFHGDLHPGNIILLRQSRAALIDYGTIGFLEASRQREFTRYIKCLASGEFYKAADYLLLMMTSVPARELDELKERMVRTIRTWTERTTVRGVPYHLKSVSAVMGNLGKLLASYGVAMEWSFMRVDRSYLSLDASLEALFGNRVNYAKLIQRYLDEAQGRELKRALWPRSVRDQAYRAINAAQQAPELVENFHQFEGRLLRDAAQVYRNTVSKAAYFFKLLAGNLLAAEVAAWFAALYGLLVQHSPWFAARLPGTGSPLVSELPRLSAGGWLGVLAGLAYLFPHTLLLWRKVSQGDPVRLDRQRR